MCHNFSPPRSRSSVELAASRTPRDSGHAKQRQGRPKPASVVEIGIAVIDTREHPQTPTRLPPVPLNSSERPNGLAAHQDAHLKPPTAAWWPPGCPPPGLHSNRGLRIIFRRMKTKPAALESSTVLLSNAPGFVFIRRKLMRSPLFEWSPGGGTSRIWPRYPGSGADRRDPSPC